MPDNSVGDAKKAYRAIDATGEAADAVLAISYAIEAQEGQPGIVLTPHCELRSA
jgi:hypothetical protein